MFESLLFAFSLGDGRRRRFVFFQRSLFSSSATESQSRRSAARSRFGKELRQLRHRAFGRRTRRSSVPQIFVVDGAQQHSRNQNILSRRGTGRSVREPWERADSEGAFALGPIKIDAERALQRKHYGDRFMFFHIAATLASLESVKVLLWTRLRALLYVVANVYLPLTFSLRHPRSIKII